MLQHSSVFAAFDLMFWNGLDSQRIQINRAFVLCHGTTALTLLTVCFVGQWRGQSSVGLWQAVISLAWHVTRLTSGPESCCSAESFTSCWSASFSPVNAPAARSVMHKHVLHPTVADTMTHTHTHTWQIPNCLHIFLNIQDIKVGSGRICLRPCHLLQGVQISQGINAFWLGGVLFHQSH